MDVNNKYIPKKQYRIYIGADRSGDVNLFQYTAHSFDNHDFAEQWINDEGERKIDYFIIETFTKP